jgi:hypothetical protein
MDGKKTWLGLIVSNVAVVIAAAGKLFSGEALTPTEITQALGAAGVIIGAVHKIKKGE